ncbi:diacylglycerol/lipid kinase family protein [Salinicoccus albus]|uniref:diacylglycerol/lipid kinase family protein n=1 Tax=Salinicoccus albus TaxID=418756 RepID=UPI001FE0B444|nr:diacylglycerol kinase family protein [Salinicoccus albus]
MKATIIINKISGKTRKYGVEYKLIKHLSDSGYDTDITYTNASGSVPLAAEASKTSDLIVAVGGDGTIGEIINGIMQSGKNPELYIVPAGTVNDYSRAFGLPLDMDTAAQNLSLPYDTIAADVLKINDFNAAYLAAFGDFMTAFTAVSSKTKNSLGRLAYIRAGIRALIKMKPFKVRIETADETIESDSLFTTASSISSVGSIKNLIPDAEIDDGCLHVLNIEPANMKEIITIICLAMRGEITKHEKVKYIQTKRMKIETTGQTRMNIDGDGHPYAPLNLEVLPQRLKLRVPKKS